MPRTTGIPLTRSEVSPERAEAIRNAVRRARAIPSASGASRLARLEDSPALLAFLSDPRVHAPIYSLPRPLTLASVEAFIRQHEAERNAGEGLLCLSFTPEGEIAAYSDLQVWPCWATGELAGGLHPGRQGLGQGAAGAVQSFAWMFETLGLERICETAAPDNVRTARLLDGLGFERMGEVESQRPDGTTRRSLVWEIDRAGWNVRQSMAGA